MPYKVCEHTGFEMVMNTALTGTMVMRVQRVLRWCSADTILRLDVQPIRFSDFGEIWFPRVHCSGVVRMRRALRRNLRWNRDFKVFVANLLTQPESTGRPIIIIIIIILVIITCQSRHKVPSLVIFLQHAQCFIPVEIVGRFPNWHESVQWVPSKSIWVEDFFNRVISSQERFILQICLCWCNEHIASVSYKCNGKPWPCPVRYVKSNCPSGRRPLSQIKMEIEMQRGQS